MIYQNLVQSTNVGIYQSLFKLLSDNDLSLDIKTKAEFLDSRFEFENNLKDCLFDNLETASKVLVAKYFDKWNNLVTGFINNELPAGASIYTVSNAKGNSNDKISAYDSDELITDTGNDTTQNSDVTTYGLDGKQLLLTLYKNNNVYDIINTDIRKTLFNNVHNLEENY